MNHDSINKEILKDLATPQPKIKVLYITPGRVRGSNAIDRAVAIFLRLKLLGKGSSRTVHA